MNLADLEEHLPIDKEYQVELHAVDPGRRKTASLTPAANAKLLTLKVSVKKIGNSDYSCSWEVSYGNDVIRGFNHIEYNLEYFEQKTLKVKNILNCYHISEPLRPYLNKHIPPIQDE